MKKNKKLFLIVFICLIGFITLQKVSADSGWDSDYGGGSYDSDWGSSWDSGSSSDWSSSSSSVNFTNNVDAIDVIALVLFITPLVLLPLILSVKNKNKNISLSINYPSISQDKINEYINKSVSELKQEFYKDFICIQNAWMNFDYNTIRKLCGDELYNTYIEELDTLKIKNEQNIMSDFVVVCDKIIDINKIDSTIIVSYYLEVKFYDYVINTETNKVVKGNKYNKHHNTYILEFTMNMDTLNNKCPNCGATLESGESTVCSYCNSTIVRETDYFVMKSKRRIQ